MVEKKNQLHQLLAVESERRKKAALIMQETAAVFAKKAEHFDGLIKTYHPYEEGGDKFESEVKRIVTTVRDKILYTAKAITTGMDAQISKEETNASGEVVAELKTNGESFGLLSSTSLLALESQLMNIRVLYHAIPTLDPVKKWNLDLSAGKGHSLTDEHTTIRTSKEQIPLVKYEATKEHPAQVEMITKDIQVGEWKTIYQSGRITPAQKSELLGRIESLIDSVKRARARANQTEVKQMKIGKKIFDFINKDIF